jgi:hypothetical protein
VANTLLKMLEAHGVIGNKAKDDAKGGTKDADAERVIDATNFVGAFLENADQPISGPSEAQKHRQALLSRLAHDTMRAKPRVTHAEYAQKHGARTGWRERKEARGQARRRRTMHIGGSRA